MFGLGDKQNHKIYDREGTKVSINRIGLDDFPHLVALYHQMTPESLYNRFHVRGVHHFDDARVLQEAKRLVMIPSRTGRGWLAFASGRRLGLDVADTPVVIGGMRVIYSDLHDRLVAHVSAAVRDDVHGRGIGTELFQFACDWAKTQGIERLIATTLPGNTAVQRSLQKLPYNTQLEADEGEDIITIYLSKEAEYLASFA